MSETVRRDGKRRVFSASNLSIAYCLLLLFTLGCVEWAAELWLPFTILLFAPPIVFVAGFFVLTPLMLWKRNWRHVALHATCVVVVFTLFMRLRWHRPPATEKVQITVITHNIGQGDRYAFTEFFPDEEPDVVLLQDAGRARSALAKQLPRHRIRTNDQFTILTPHTILRADLVDAVKWRDRPIAARYELMIHGREIAFYNVHMPTPRPSLRGIFSPRVWLEIVGIRSASTEGFPSYRAWIDARVALITALVSEIEKEKLPFIVGGDFNMPDHGRMYRIATKGMTDAFVTAGNGWGLTFPGSKDSKVAAILGPWLRIDYLFAGKGWKPVECRTANDPRSQHRAVFGRFAPMP